MNRAAAIPETSDASAVGRPALVARWLDLTRHVLPAMAADHRWPIRRDHCFMRVCLDEAFGAPWTRAVKKPAVRTMRDDQLASAIGVAEDIVRLPQTLAARNAHSLRGRALERTRAAAITRG